MTQYYSGPSNLYILSWEERMRAKYGPWVYEKRWWFIPATSWRWREVEYREKYGRKYRLVDIYPFQESIYFIDGTGIRNQFESGNFPKWVDKTKMAEQRLRYL